MADVTVPLSPTDRAICDAVAKLDLAVEREASVGRDEMRLVCRDLWQAMEKDRQRRAELMLAPDPGQLRGEFGAFKRRLRILSDIGPQILVASGVLDPEDAVAFARFDARPFAFLFELTPERFEVLFQLILDIEEQNR
ncbi:hypothetical protein ABE438_17595 [Bosea sp. TWI1241]|uniref:hypothetical protein n=1 Tax=Bosea sp. TWI1241 TaxID=3148904 RepID=UPI0032080454